MAESGQCPQCHCCGTTWELCLNCVLLAPSHPDALVPCVVCWGLRGWWQCLGGCTPWAAHPVREEGNTYARPTE
jgi:hypothetical protein